MCLVQHPSFHLSEHRDHKGLKWRIHRRQPSEVFLKEVQLFSHRLFLARLSEEDDLLGIASDHFFKPFEQLPTHFSM